MCRATYTSMGGCDDGRGATRPASVIPAAATAAPPITQRRRPRTAADATPRTRDERLSSAPETNDSGWLYRFGPLPQTEVIRKLIDYREDCVQRGRAKNASAWSKLSARFFH